MSQNELGKKSAPIIIGAVILALAMIIATCVAIKLHKNKVEESTTTSTTETSTEKSAYLVDLAYIERMVKEERFTDKFETLKASSFEKSSTASKEAYWEGIQSGKTVNPLLLAATSSYLSDLGLKTPKVKPSELYGEDGKLNKKGEETLEAVRKVIFSSDVDVLTTDLGSTAGKYYNSTPSKDDGGIEYAKKVGIKGNTVCWVITTKRVDVDAAFEDLVEKEEKGEKATTKSSKEGEKKLVQLVRCGNTVDPNPPKPTPKPTPTTKTPSTKPPVTKAPTTKTPTTKTPTTKPNIPTITFPDITLPTITTRPQTTKDKSKDPVNQGNAQRGGGTQNPEEKATSAYQPEKPSKQTTVKTVEPTTVPSTTKPATTKPATTKPAQTNPTTTAPTAVPTQKPSSYYKDDTGKTTVITPDVTFSGRPVLPD